MDRKFVDMNVIAVFLDESHVGHTYIPAALRPGLEGVSGCPEPLRSSGASVGGYGCAIPWLGTGHQRIQKIPGRCGHYLDGVIERRLVGFRRLVEARQLPYELE